MKHAAMLVIEAEYKMTELDSMGAEKKYNIQIIKFLIKNQLILLFRGKDGNTLIFTGVPSCGIIGNLAIELSG